MDDLYAKDIFEYNNAIIENVCHTLDYRGSRKYSHMGVTHKDYVGENQLGIRFKKKELCLSFFWPKLSIFCHFRFLKYCSDFIL